MQKNRGWGVSGWGRLKGQGGCEQRIEFFVKIKKKNSGGRRGGGVTTDGGGILMNVYEELVIVKMRKKEIKKCKKNRGGRVGDGGRGLVGEGEGVGW